MPLRVSSLPLMASVGPFAPLGVVEEREHVAHAAFEGASERGEFGASGRTAFDGEGFDELDHHAPSLAPVLVRVAGDDLLARAVREGERLVRGVGEQIVGARLLPVGGASPTVHGGSRNRCAPCSGSPPRPGQRRAEPLGVPSLA